MRDVLAADVPGAELPVVVLRSFGRQLTVLWGAAWPQLEVRGQEAGSGKQQSPPGRPSVSTWILTIWPEATGQTVYDLLHIGVM